MTYRSHLQRSCRHPNTSKSNIRAVQLWLIAGESLCVKVIHVFKNRNGLLIIIMGPVTVKDESISMWTIPVIDSTTAWLESTEGFLRGSSRSSSSKTVMEKLKLKCVLFGWSHTVLSLITVQYIRNHFYALVHDPSGSPESVLPPRPLHTWEGLPRVLSSQRSQNMPDMPLPNHYYIYDPGPQNLKAE